MHSWKFHGRRWFYLVIQEAWSLVISSTMVKPEVFKFKNVILACAILPVFVCLQKYLR